jgi:predicted nucleic acid-binding protein
MYKHYTCLLFLPYHLQPMDVVQAAIAKYEGDAGFLYEALFVATEDKKFKSMQQVRGGT